MRSSKWLVALWLGFLSYGCHDEPGKTEAEDHSKLCALGGAAFNAATNECLCAAAQKWTGSRCEPDPAVPAPVEKASTLLPAPPEKPNDEKAKGEAVPGVPADLVERLEKGCKEAKAEWLADLQFCQCPDRKVLVGSRCLKLPGRVTDDACGRAVNPGIWRKGECECPGALTFVPQRGGCVVPAKGKAAVQILSCESSLDNGKWEKAKERCQCPKGRVWVDELCWVQHRLSSAIVCEGDFNGGKWDWGEKRCDCPGGFLWINQTCQDPHRLPIAKVCESEWNRGRWNSAQQRCACPSGYWDPKTLLCRGRD